MIYIFIIYFLFFNILNVITYFTNLFKFSKMKKSIKKLNKIIKGIKNIDMERKKLDFRFEKSEITLSSGFTLYSLDEIGEGAFGKIYLGVNNKTKEYVAIKLEIPNSIRSQLQIENKIYNILKGGGKNKNKNFYKNYK